MNRTWAAGLVIGFTTAAALALQIVVVVFLCQHFGNALLAIYCGLFAQACTVLTLFWLLSRPVAEKKTITTPAADPIPFADFVDFTPADDSTPPLVPPTSPIMTPFETWMRARREMFALEKEGGSISEVEQAQAKLDQAWFNMSPEEKYRAGVEEADFWKYG